MIEIVASFLLFLLVYFLGSLALVQEVIKPKKYRVQDGATHGKHWATNYSKIIGISLLLSLVSTTLAYLFFL